MLLYRSQQKGLMHEGSPIRLEVRLYSSAPGKGKKEIHDQDWLNAYHSLDLEQMLEPDSKAIIRTVGEFVANISADVLCNHPMLIPALEEPNIAVSLFFKRKTESDRPEDCRPEYMGRPVVYPSDRGDISLKFPIEDLVQTVFENRPDKLRETIVHEFAHHLIDCTDNHHHYGSPQTGRWESVKLYLGKIKGEGLCSIVQTRDMGPDVWRQDRYLRGLRNHFMDFASDKMSFQQFNKTIDPYLYSFGRLMVYTIGVQMMGGDAQDIEDNMPLPEEITLNLLDELAPLTPGEFIGRYEEACKEVGIYGSIDEYGFPSSRVLTTGFYNKLREMSNIKSD